MEKKIIDISVYQKGVNYEQVKKDGVEGAILRCGFTGYGSKKTKQKDAMFETHYAGFVNAGVPVGVYWYSCATTEAEAREEAKLTLEYIKGKNIELPVYFDTEDAHNTEKYAKQSQYSIGRTALTKVAKAYCEEIEKAGYYVGIYASTSWLNNQLKMSELKAYDVWVAQYSSKCQYSGAYGMWQYSGSGKVAGISGNVDMNKCYKDYVTIIKNAGLNGQKKTTPQKPAEKKKTVEELVDEVLANVWGTGKARKEALTKAGYNYTEVQNAVNKRLAEQNKPVLYTVRKGDTLSSIAKKYGTTWLKLYTANISVIGLNPNVIKPGQILTIKK